MPASAERWFQGFRHSDSSRISSAWGQPLLVMSIKHFSIWFFLPVGGSMAYRVENCTGSQEDFFSAVMTFWVILENALLSMLLIPHLQKKDNVVRIIFIKCLAHSRKNLCIHSGGFWCPHAKFELQDLLMLCVLCQHKACCLCYS